MKILVIMKSISVCLHLFNKSVTSIKYSKDITAMHVYNMHCKVKYDMYYSTPVLYGFAFIRRCLKKRQHHFSVHHIDSIIQCEIVFTKTLKEFL